MKPLTKVRVCGLVLDKMLMKHLAKKKDETSHYLNLLTPRIYFTGKLSNLLSSRIEFMESSPKVCVWMRDNVKWDDHDLNFVGWHDPIQCLVELGTIVRIFCLVDG